MCNRQPFWLNPSQLMMAMVCYDCAKCHHPPHLKLLEYVPKYITEPYCIFRSRSTFHPKQVGCGRCCHLRTLLLNPKAKLIFWLIAQILTLVCTISSASPRFPYLSSGRLFWQSTCITRKKSDPMSQCFTFEYYLSPHWAEVPCTDEDPIRSEQCNTILPCMYHTHCSSSLHLCITLLYCM